MADVGQEGALRPVCIFCQDFSSLYLAQGVAQRLGALVNQVFQMAALRGSGVAQAKPGTPTPVPPGSDYLFDIASVPEDLALRGSGRPVYAILSFTNPAAVTINPTSGYSCTTAELGAEAPAWWCAQGTATVTTEIVLAGQLRKVNWTLVSITPIAVNADVRWRVAQVTLQP